MSIINNKNCFFCKKSKKKLLLECDCKKIYCLKHLLPETHNCTFDFKKKGRERIKEENPKVINEKIIKI
jgi:AN1-type zinc finger protein 5/6